MSVIINQTEELHQNRLAPKSQFEVVHSVSDERTILIRMMQNFDNVQGSMRITARQARMVASELQNLASLISDMEDEEHERHMDDIYLTLTRDGGESL